MQIEKDVSRRSVRTIPDKLFYELWKKANEIPELNLYIDTIIGVKSKNHQIYTKYYISLEHFIELLENVHKAAWLSVKDIVNLSGMKKADFAYLFCFPIRTLENWYDNSRPCPPYIRLMLLKYFKIIKLGNHIYISSEEPKARETKTNKNETTKTSNQNNKILTENESYFDQAIRHQEDYLPIYTREYMDNFSKWEKEHIHTSNDNITKLLERTNYLKNNKSTQDKN